MDNNYNLEIFNPDKFAPNVADEIVAAISDALMDQDDCSLVVAGGKTPAGIYRLLSRPPRVNHIDWSALDIFWGDDRWVPHDHVSSNYKLLEETLLGNVSIPQQNIFPIDTSLASPDDAAKAYDKTIKAYLDAKSNKEKRFDIVLLGVGQDGHTASLFPNSPNINVTDKYAVPAQTFEEPQERVSLTSAALFSAKRIYFIVKGSNKADIVAKILKSDDKTAKDYPALLYKNATGKVTWFLDAEAAAQL